jgi:iron(III) transport system ATP-binding protein
MAFLTVNAISKSENGNVLVDHVSFEQDPLQKIAIAGATGSGKTSLLKMMAGLLQPDSGEILFEDKRVKGPNDQLLTGHQSIAYLSQYFELRNNYRVHELLEMNNKIEEAIAQKIYTVCRISHLLKRRTDQLSGGERQRIVLAGLLTRSPKLLLLDEPFSNLDATNKAVIKSVVDDMGTQLNITCIMVSHDAADILSWADRILVMKDGNIIQDATAKEVYSNPVNEYAAGLLGSYNLINTSLFHQLGIEFMGEQKFIRPEQFIITTANLYMLSGTLVKKVFYGSYYMLYVSVKGQILQVRAYDDGFALGDVVYLNVKNNV